jgi:WXXGXW repeat (2 copies)
MFPHPRANKEAAAMKPVFPKITVACLLLGGALSGCVVAPAPGYYRAGVVVSEVEPPPPRYEVVGVAPSPGYIWIGGAWFWEGGRYAWHPGRWEAPRPGYRWVPHTWRREGNRWQMDGGRWEHEGREEHREERR